MAFSRRNPILSNTFGFSMFPLYFRHHYCLDVDGLPLNDDVVQTQLQEIMWRHKKEVRRLQQQVARARQSGHSETGGKVDLQLLQEELSELPTEKEVSVLQRILQFMILLPI